MPKGNENDEMMAKNHQNRLELSTMEMFERMKIDNGLIDSIDSLE